MIWTDMALRGTAAAGLVLAYAGLCLATLRHVQRQRHQAAQETAALASTASTTNAGSDGSDAPPVLVLYGSQTGMAESLAQDIAHRLHASGQAVALRPMNTVDATLLQRSRCALWIVSTYGEGDAPDNAALFHAHTMAMAPPLDLSGLRYAVLALGDSQYRQFCGFGRAVDDWLQHSGATPHCTRLEWDSGKADGDMATLHAWQHQLAQWLGLTTPAPSHTLSNLAAFTDWTLHHRQHLNPGSAGGAVYHLEFTPPNGAADWQSGDLVDVRLPGDADAQPRSYSIASIPQEGQEGRVHLLVRQTQRADGTPGHASHWLTAGMALGDAVAMRLHPHRHFQLGDNAQRPLILIGNGTGMAGLRSHLRARVLAGATPNWLVFGERHAACDFHYRDEIMQWQAQQLLQRVDCAFSRDGGPRVYVQDRLREAAATLREWVAQDAAIYVCGSLQGMASEVDQALRDILGDTALHALQATGRYRRDVY